MGRKIRILLAKAGLDGHDRGVITVAMACKDAGMEVIYGGLHLTPEEIVNTAIQEAVDVIGISSLSDAHMTQVPRIIAELKKKGAADIPVIVGGFIQPEDIPALKDKGVADVFGHIAICPMVGAIMRRTTRTAIYKVDPGDRMVSGSMEVTKWTRIFGLQWPGGKRCTGASSTVKEKGNF
jgi:methylmalonyl-CoA mutase C-terminal domain/subunit